MDGLCLSGPFSMISDSAMFVSPCQICGASNIHLWLSRMLRYALCSDISFRDTHNFLQDRALAVRLCGWHDLVTTSGGFNVG